MNWITALGLVGAALTTFSSVPQVMKTIRTKQTKDLSLGMYVMVAIGVLIWLIYGLLIKDLVIILADSISLVFLCTILGLKLKYG